MSDEKKISKARAVIGGLLFFSGIFMLLGVAFNANGASGGAGVFNLAIGTPLFWPILKGWLNRLGKK